MNAQSQSSNQFLKHVVGKSLSHQSIMFSVDPGKTWVESGQQTQEYPLPVFNSVLHVCFSDVLYVLFGGAQIHQETI